MVAAVASYGCGSVGAVVVLLVFNSTGMYLLLIARSKQKLRTKLRRKRIITINTCRQRERTQLNFEENEYND